MTLYIELGGRSVIEHAVRQAVSACALTNSKSPGAFAPHKTAQATEDLIEFLTFLFGGSPFYEGQAIHQAFSCLCNSHPGFDEVRDVLLQELTRRPQTAGLRPQVHAALEQIRHHAVRLPLPAHSQERPYAQARHF
jgi:truncated hemoglobin YjbI